MRQKHTFRQHRFAFGDGVPIRHHDIGGPILRDAHDSRAITREHLASRTADADILRVDCSAQAYADHSATKASDDSFHCDAPAAIH